LCLFALLKTAPDEADANVVEKILIHRRREPKDEQEDELLSDDENDVEYFVKYKNYSYLHSKWSTIKELGVGDKRIHMKVKRYHQKRAATTNLFELPDEDEPINPDYVEVDRVLDVAKHEENGEMITHYLVKWKSLNYEDSTWELEKDVPDDKVQVYYKLRQVPPISQQGVRVSIAVNNHGLI
jgi:chromodomain-helicase-DNA-binding protein 7